MLDLWTHIGASALRLIEGLLLSFLIAVPLGLLLSHSPRMNRIGSPLLYLAYPIPKLALLPLVMLVMHIGEAAKITMIVLILVFQVILTVRDAALHIPRENFHIMTSLGANRRQILRWVVLPAILPETLTALRIAVGTSASVLFFTETFGTDRGVGFYIIDAWMRLDYGHMALGIAALSLLGLALFFAIDRLEKHVCKWKTLLNDRVG
jgi:NitT/TauT family transport system permease protein